MVQQLQTAACALIILFAAIGTVSVSLRLWSRYITRNWGLDDGLILFAYLLAVGETVCVYQYTLLSYQGYHEADIPPLSINRQVLAAKYNIANQVLYNPILSLIKLSVVVFLRRLEDRRLSVKYNLYALAVFEFMFMIASTLVDIFQCSPVQYTWESAWMKANGETGICINVEQFFLAQAGIALFTDCWVLVIPAIMLWHLRMPRRQKLAVFGIIGAGGIVVVVSVVRIIIYAWRFNPNNHDQSWGVGFTTSGMVVHVGFLAACAPALKAIFSRYLPKVFSSSRGYMTRNHTYYGYQRSGTTNITSARNNDTGVSGITVTNTIHVSQEGDEHEMRSGIGRHKQPSESQEEIFQNGDTPSVDSRPNGKTSPKEFVESGW